MVREMKIKRIILLIIHRLFFFDSYNDFSWEDFLLKITDSWEEFSYYR